MGHPTGIRSFTAVRRKALALSAAIAAGLLATQAQAASVNAGTLDHFQTMTAAGLATARVTDARGLAEANGYEFRGGIGVSAFAESPGSGTSIANSRASLSDTFRVLDTSGLVDLSGAVFMLNVPILASGSVLSINNVFPRNPAFYSLANAHYDYAWSVGGFTGEGFANSSKRSSGGVFETAGGSPYEIVSLRVGSGDLIDLSFSASARASTMGLPGTAAKASTDFSHTLRWGGVTAISAMDRSGNALVLPDGFALSLVSASSGFDYWNAAGRNPFTAGVPEPATWAMMLIGFFGMGAAMRSRRAQAARRRVTVSTT